MRINSGFPIQNTGELERAQKKPAQREAQGNEGVTTALSSDVVQLSALEKKANSAAEIRQEKVAALKQSVEEGSYQVSDAALADAILRDVLRG
jgi:flagellar biosynthesis anti-sigma factor FlgM